MNVPVIIQNEKTNMLEQTMKGTHLSYIHHLTCQNGRGQGHQCLAGKSQVPRVPTQFHGCAGAD